MACSLHRIGKKNSYGPLIKYVDELPTSVSFNSSQSLEYDLPEARKYTWTLYGYKRRETQEMSVDLDELK